MIVNNESRPHLVSIESTYLADYILTAARVSTMQSFRDLFPSEALRKGLHIRLSSITILFTDLCGSTAFYRRVGDGPAFDRVTAHFDILRNNVASAGGAIVKTIGDAIMGVFPTPETGLQAVKGILREIEAYNAKHGDWPLRLRLGLNSGPALVVTLNEKLDYFGSTVNLASKLERQSRSNEVILPQSVFNLLTVSRDEWEIEPAEVTVPGEDGPLAVVRLRLQSRSKE
jgi:class 3 adenylate cyclase